MAPDRGIVSPPDLILSFKPREDIIRTLRAIKPSTYLINVPSDQSWAVEYRFSSYHGPCSGEDPDGYRSHQHHRRLGPCHWILRLNPLRCHVLAVRDLFPGLSQTVQGSVGRTASARQKECGDDDAEPVRFASNPHRIDES